ncbi:unnamed protein product [Larinioides sclopetarius]|uniref:Gustatory receptor n=1 Tax=Larinioides sclopetarius TaxID=280406 RepID=A0AAV1Z609_9ARAC
MKGLVLGSNVKQFLPDESGSNENPTLRKNEAFKMKDIFRPILFLFLLCGIDMAIPKRRWVTAFSILFHFMCLGVIVFKIICISLQFQWSIFVTILVKMTSLLLWWFVRTKREKIQELIEELDHVKEEMEQSDFKEALKRSKMAAVFALLVICLQPFVLSLRYLTDQEESIACTLIHASSKRSIQSVLGVFLHESASIYVNTSITYALALFYSLYCHIFASSLRDSDRSVSCAFHLYQQVIKIFKEMEDALSSLIFIAFAHFLVSLFKDMIVLVIVLQNGKVWNFLSYGVDFLIIGALTTVAVLSADELQSRANILRRFLSTFVPYDLRISCARILEDKEDLKLTDLKEAFPG